MSAFIKEWFFFAKELLPPFRACPCHNKLPVSSVQRTQTHDGFALVQIPEFVAVNGHAVKLLCHAARACEGVGSFGVILGVGAMAVNVTHDIMIT